MPKGKRATLLYLELKRECFELDNLLQACSNAASISEPMQLNQLRGGRGIYDLP